MSKLTIFTVRDSKADAYLVPYHMPNVPLAVRIMANSVNDPEHPFCLNPEDYSLYEIGVFDELTGKVTPHEAPIHILNLVELKKHLETTEVQQEAE